jgi:hypothetical protein
MTSTSKRPLARALLGLAAAALALGTTAASAQAACVSAALYDYAQYKAGQRTALSRLKFDTQFMLCFTSQTSGFVQILDTPADGDIEVIYPNSFLNDGNGNLQYAAIEGGREYCFGDSDTFPIYHPRSEGNTGKLAITVTLSAENQLEAEGWELPGEVKKYLGSHKESGNSCTGRDILYISYLAE